jgi:hypothetical protein
MEGSRYLEDGRLTIFKRDGTFYARIRISPVKYIWRSLKTTDLETAIRVGRRLLFYLEQRAEQGLPLKSKGKSSVFPRSHLGCFISEITLASSEPKHRPFKIKVALDQNCTQEYDRHGNCIFRGALYEKNSFGGPRFNCLHF